MTETAENNPPWTQCEVHTQHTDMDCEFCDTQLAAQNTYLLEAQQRALVLNKSLAAKNNGIPFIETQPVVAVLMVQTMADMIFTDPKHRMAFEINFHARLIDQMIEVEKQTIRQQLVGGDMRMHRDMKKGRG